MSARPETYAGEAGWIMYNIGKCCCQIIERCSRLVLHFTSTGEGIQQCPLPTRVELQCSKSLDQVIRLQLSVEEFSFPTARCCSVLLFDNSAVRLSL